jgi:hypothetical protein
MLKNYKVVGIFLGIFATHIFGQGNNINLEELKAPSMPSASIIGIQANEINQPKSLKSLEAAVFSNYLDSENQLTLPNNFALEISPFMLSGRKNFDYKEYINEKDSIWKNIKRNFTFSVSSTNNFLIGDSTSSNAMGLGLRTILLNGKVDGDLEKKFIMIDSLMEKNLEYYANVQSWTTVFQETISETAKLIDLQYYLLKNSTTEGMNNVVNEAFEKFIQYKTPLDSVATRFEELSNKTSTKTLARYRELLHEVKTNRYGFRWELDAAMALSFPTNNFEFSYVPRWALWTNFSYRCEEVEELVFIGYARMMFNNDKYIDIYKPIDASFENGSIYDFGARFAFVLDKFSLEAEYIYRLNSTKEVRVIDGKDFVYKDNNNTEKFTFNINYNMSDNITLSYNIGKGFDNILPSDNNFISNLTVNFGFGAFNLDDLLGTNKSN